MQEASAPTINDRIALRVRELRAARGLSLDALARQCGVSRSMISLIERGESSPTAVVLEKLAAGLGVYRFAVRRAAAGAEPGRARVPTSCRGGIRDSGYVRRNVSPAGAGTPIQIVEVSFPGRARVAYETGARDCTCTSRSGCSKARSTSRSGDERHRLGRATAWPCS